MVTPKRIPPTDEDDKPNTLAAWNETRESRIPKIASMADPLP
jgi:hypothetical protein